MTTMAAQGAFVSDTPGPAHGTAMKAHQLPGKFLTSHGVRWCTVFLPVDSMGKSKDQSSLHFS